MKTITLTLNPAFDMHCKTKKFKKGRENFFEVLSIDAGGKGVNVSRALNAFDVPSKAIVVVGSENGDEYCKKLKEANLDFEPVFVDGRIRQNVILHDDTAEETRVSFNGFSVDGGLFSKVVQAIGDIDEETIVTLTGSIPEGVPIAEVKEFVKQLNFKGAKVVIDNRSFSLDDILETKPFLIKPNQQEISAYYGREIKTLDEMVEIAAEIHTKGVNNVIISAGSRGAVLACEEGVYKVVPPKTAVISTVGAGDSMIAGFIYAYVSGRDMSECLKYAVSFGTAACAQNGTMPPMKNDIIAIKLSL